MGTNYSFDGGISIDPPLNFAQIKQAQQKALELLREGFDKKHASAENVFEGYMPLKLSLETFDKDTDDGVLKVTRAIELVPSHGTDGSLRYDMADLVLKLIQEFPGHTFQGDVVALCEDGAWAVKLTVGPGQSGSPEIRQTQGKTYIHWEDKSTYTPVSDLL